MLALGHRCPRGRQTRIQWMPRCPADFPNLQSHSVGGVVAPRDESSQDFVGQDSWPVILVCRTRLTAGDQMDRPGGLSYAPSSTRARFSPRIRRASSTVTPNSSSARVSTWKTASIQPRGKKDESVPNSSRRGPATSSARRNTVVRLSSSYRIQELLLEVSR